MKTETLTKIAIASTLCAPSCAVEHGVVVERQELPDENALYINLIDAKHEKARAQSTFVFKPGEYMADRKLFFQDSTYMEPFIYALPGDTVSFYNPFHVTYVKMNKCNRIRDINGIQERDIVSQMRPLIREYWDWVHNNRWCK